LLNHKFQLKNGQLNSFQKLKIFTKFLKIGATSASLTRRAISAYGLKPPAAGGEGASLGNFTFFSQK